MKSGAGLINFISWVALFLKGSLGIMGLIVLFKLSKALDIYISGEKDDNFF
ncbi:hypothetical protein [uncultured Parvimonas sp.]|uniref:hypothetical protein n=1 Tax=uncultured Parvimonas sp. TaxID=747372 RepID=UPI00325FD081